MSYAHDVRVYGALVAVLIVRCFAARVRAHTRDVFVMCGSLVPMRLQ